MDLWDWYFVLVLPLALVVMLCISWWDRKNQREFDARMERYRQEILRRYGNDDKS